MNTIICQRTCYAIYRSTILVMAMMNMTKIIKLILMDESKNVVPSYINKIKGKTHWMMLSCWQELDAELKIYKGGRHRSQNVKKHMDGAWDMNHPNGHTYEAERIIVISYGHHVQQKRGNVFLDRSRESWNKRTMPALLSYAFSKFDKFPTTQHNTVAVW